MISVNSAQVKRAVHRQGQPIEEKVTGGNETSVLCDLDC